MKNRILSTLLVGFITGVITETISFILALITPTNMKFLSNYLNPASGNLIAGIVFLSFSVGIITAFLGMVYIFIYKYIPVKNLIYRPIVFFVGISVLLGISTLILSTRYYTITFYFTEFLISILISFVEGVIFGILSVKMLRLEKKIKPSPLIMIIKFFKPSWRKITLVLLFLVAFLVINYFITSYTYISMVAPYITYTPLYSTWFYQCSKAVSQGNLTEFNKTLNEYFNIEANDAQNRTFSNTLLYNRKESMYSSMLLPLSLSIGITPLESSFNQSPIWSEVFFIDESNWEMFIIAVFLYWYLLSCIIVWVYDRFRGKKK